MAFSTDLSVNHQVIAANSHTYTVPTEALYLDRTLVCHDFIYLLDGEWLFSETIDAQEVNYLLRPDDVLILPAGNHHYTRLPCKAGTRTLCLHITKEAGDMENVGEHVISLPSQINCRTNRQVKALFQEIVSVFWAEDSYKQHRLSALFTLLICELAHIQQPKNDLDEVHRAIRLINKTPHKTLSAEALAASLCTDPRKLSVRFREATGETLHAYQINRKLEMIALQLRVEPELRLKELAALFGFYDEFYLSKLFKKKYGVSPREYRKEHPL